MVSFELTDTQIIIAYRRLIDKHKLEITNKYTGIRHGHTLFKKYDKYDNFVYKRSINTETGAGYEFIPKSIRDKK